MAIVATPYAHRVAAPMGAEETGRGAQQVTDVHDRAVGALRRLARLVPPIERLRQQQDALAAEVARLRARQGTLSP